MIKNIFKKIKKYKHNKKYRTQIHNYILSKIFKHLIKNFMKQSIFYFTNKSMFPLSFILYYTLNPIINILYL